jgi:wyosine [tRNA(Phe)-imidazoG37] synthetase (radical SAM superfamily)
MFDIHFFKKSLPWKRKILAGEFSIQSTKEIYQNFESIRTFKPKIFNVETTNNCNMKCVMCPRTKLMTRGVSNLSEEQFNNILEQLSPQEDEDIQRFEDFIHNEYGENLKVPSENSFFFSFLSRCLILHGYGEPLLDKQIVSRVANATRRKIPTYFSCVPANLTLEKASKLMDVGLTVLKVSIDSLDDITQKKIRGPKNNFRSAYETVLKIIELKEKMNYKTVIAPTMIKLTNTEEANTMARDFLQLWDKRDVFAYVKSQDNRWFYEEDSQLENHSHHSKQYCEFPWISMSISAEGKAVPCTQDYNTEVILGDTNSTNLESIWNGEEYAKLRMYHLTGNFPKGHKCSTRCDQKKIYEYLKS